jgi:hypothetical protein
MWLAEHVARMGGEKRCISVVVGILKTRDHLEGVGLHRRTRLSWAEIRYGDTKSLSIKPRCIRTVRESNPLQIIIIIIKRSPDYKLHICGERSHCRSHSRSTITSCTSWLKQRRSRCAVWGSPVWIPTVTSFPLVRRWQCRDNCYSRRHSQESFKSIPRISY